MVWSFTAPLRQAASVQSSSGASGAGGKYAGWVSPNGVIRLPQGRIWNSWQEVPDELVRNFPIRDKTNPVYTDPKYIKWRKLQFFFAQNDGLETWRKMGARDIALFRVTQAILLGTGVWASYVIYNHLFGKKKK